MKQSNHDNYDNKWNRNDTATSVSFLLSDWSQFGLSERTYYHFDLVIAGKKQKTHPIIPKKQTNPTNFSNPTFCGISSLLECVPYIPLTKRTKKYRRYFRERHRDFNLHAKLARESLQPFHIPSENETNSTVELTSNPQQMNKKRKHILEEEKQTNIQKSPINNRKQKYKRNDPFYPMNPKRSIQNIQYHFPMNLPLPISHTTKVTYAYEMTKIVICIDASPTMASTIGFQMNNDDDDDKFTCCALDRIGPMIQQYLTSLITPIPATTFVNETSKSNTSSESRSRSGSGSGGNYWIPEIAVTVIAVYNGPDDSNQKSIKSNIFIKDYRIKDTSAANLLANQISKWVISDVEHNIALRFTYKSSQSFQSDLRELLQISSLALESTLPSCARPMILIISDCRSIYCGNVMDYICATHTPDDYSTLHTDIPTFPALEDVPIHILNLIPPTSSSTTQSQSSFLSNEIEALSNICEVSNGCYLDSNILQELSQTIVGQIPTSSPLHFDHFISYRKRGNTGTMRPNVLQWYTLFTLSLLTPLTNHLSWGWMASLTDYQQLEHKKQNHFDNYIKAELDGKHIYGERLDWNDDKNIRNIPSSSMIHTSSLNTYKQSWNITIIHSYSLSPIRMKGILHQRARQNFRAKKFGMDDDNGKISIHFTLPLDFCIMLHYELSYIPTYSQHLGLVNIKLGLTGDDYLIHNVKHEFNKRLLSGQTLHPPQHQKTRYSTVLELATNKICKLLQWIKSEDELEKDLCLMDESDHLDPMESKFLYILDSLRWGQLHRHFLVKKIDLVCVGGESIKKKKTDLNENDNVVLVPYSNKYVAYDNHGNDQMSKFFNSWCTHVTPDKKYIKIISSSKRNLEAFYVIEFQPSHIASRLYHIYIFICGVHVKERIQMFSTLMKDLNELTNLILVPKPLEDHFLTSERTLKTKPEYQARKSIWYEKYKLATDWELDSDPDILSLLVRRRIEIEHFWLIDSSSSHALLIKYVHYDQTDETNVTTEENQNQVYLIQNELHLDSHHISIHLQIEAPDKTFLFRFGRKEELSTLNYFSNESKILDEKCGNALQSRRRLLNMFDPHMSKIYSSKFQQRDVQLLLLYSSCLIMKLPFFHSSANAANIILDDLTSNFLLSLEQRSKKKVAKLGIGSSNNMDLSIDQGMWYLIEHNASVHSIVYFPITSMENIPGNSIIFNDDEKESIYREMKVFTFDISNLYCPIGLQIDGMNAENTQHFDLLSEFKALLDDEHDRNYSRASFLALRQLQEGGSTDNHSICFQPNDFNRVLNPLSEIEIANSFITSSKSMSKQNSSMGVPSVINNLFKPVPGDNSYFYFSGKETEDPLFEKEIDDKMQEKLMREDIIKLDSDEESYDSMNEDEIESEAQTSYENDVEVTRREDVDPTNYCENSSESSPIYVKFLLDGKIASYEDLKAQTKSSNLKAYITTFGNQLNSNLLMTEGLPRMHAYVALALRNSLEAYIASLTLERLNHASSSIQDIDAKAAMKCLIAADHVSTDTIPVELYSSTYDRIYLLSASNNNDRAKGFSRLFSELSSESIITLINIRFDTYCITTMEDITGSFWAFVQVQQLRGFISIIVYHPFGMQAAEKTKERIKFAMKEKLFRVNQLLLLESLHATHQASLDMIPLRNSSSIEGKSLSSTSLSANTEDMKVHENTHHESEIDISMTGTYECAIVFEECFELNRRCKMDQTIIALESSILHPFAVSNRRGIFVYKDKTGHIFYMQLTPRSKSNFKNESEDLILLQVHGINPPDESITVQLTRLLRKKMMMLSVDAISIVLQKNPHYNLLPADIKFLEMFQNTWEKIEPENDKNKNKDCYYEFPKYVYDPLLILMYFRQNMIGSTYFHRLQEAIIEDEQEKGSGTAFRTPSSRSFLKTGLLLRYDYKHFRIYYNNTPSPLNPNLQPVSTLTNKGLSLKTQTGNGIALIDFFLLRGDGTSVDNVYVGASIPPKHALKSLEEEFLAFRKLSESEIPEGQALYPFRLRVKISNSTLNSDSLHQWIEMTLNQALVGWFIEQQLLKLKNELRNPYDLFSKSKSDCSKGSTMRYSSSDQVGKSFSIHEKTLHQAHRLPTPTVEKIEQKVITSSTNIAKLTLNLLEQAVFGSLFGDKRSFLNDKEMSIIRVEKKVGPKLVSLSRTGKESGVQITELLPNGKRLLFDTPMDSPEYICLFNFQLRQIQGESMMENNTDVIKPSMLMFNQVIIEEAFGENKIPDSMTQALSFLKSTNPIAFRRSISFILSVGRKSQCLFTYNWNPPLLKETKRRFRENEEHLIEIERKRRQVSIKRSLGSLSLIYNKETNLPKLSEENNEEMMGRHNTITPRHLNNSRSHSLNKENADKSTSVTSNRRNRTPRVITRPKLKGRSEKGAAMQAAIASRARASTRTMVTGSKTIIYDKKKYKGSKDKSNNVKEQSSTKLSKEMNRSSRLKDEEEDPQKQSNSRQIQANNDEQSENSSIQYSSKRHLTNERKDVPRMIVSKKTGAKDMEIQNGISRKLFYDYPCLQGAWDPWKLMTRRFSLYQKSYFTYQLVKERRQREDVVRSMLKLFKSFSSTTRSCCCELPVFFVSSTTSMQSILAELSSALIDFFSHLVIGIDMKPMVILRDKNSSSSVNRLKSGNYFYITNFFTSKYGFCFVILELSINRCKLSRKHIILCKVWYSILRNSENNTNIVKKKRLIKMEQNSSMLAQLMHIFPVEVGLGVALFNYSITSLKRLVRSNTKQNEDRSIISLLRQITSQYPLKRQCIMPGLKHRIYRRKILLKEYMQENMLSDCPIKAILQYMSQNTSTYDMIECGRFETCLSTNLGGNNSTVNLFLTLNEETSSACDLFVLCRSEGNYLDRVVRSDDNLYIMTRIDKIMEAADKTIRNRLHLAAKDFRRLHQTPNSRMKVNKNH